MKNLKAEMLNIVLNESNGTTNKRLTYLASDLLEYVKQLHILHFRIKQPKALHDLIGDLYETIQEETDTLVERCIARGFILPEHLNEISQYRPRLNANEVGIEEFMNSLCADLTDFVDITSEPEYITINEIIVGLMGKLDEYRYKIYLTSQGD